MIYQKRVGMLNVNMYAVSDGQHRTALIDPGDEAQSILQAVRERGLTVEAILLTHAHFDHIGAVEELVNRTGATVYIHGEEIPRLTDGRLNLSDSVLWEPITFHGDVTAVKDGDKVTVGENVFTVMHTPGHSPGSVCYYLEKENKLFSGDTLFLESIGRLDFPGGDATAMRRSLDRLLAMDGAIVVYPGHEASTTIEHEKQYNPYV